MAVISGFAGHVLNLLAFDCGKMHKMRPSCVKAVANFVSLVREQLLLKLHFLTNHVMFGSVLHAQVLVECDGDIGNILH